MKQKLEKMIQDFMSKYPNRKSHGENALKLLNKYDDNKAFYRDSFTSGHFTGSVIVLNEEKTKALMMHHKKLNRWQNFGGHADGDMDLHAVAKRELEEECGIAPEKVFMPEEILNIDYHIMPEYKGEPEHMHVDVHFYALVDENIDFIKQDEEVNDIGWFSVEEVLSDKEGKFNDSSRLMLKNLL